MEEQKRPVLSLKRATAGAVAKLPRNTDSAENAAHAGAGAAAGTKRSRANLKKLNLLFAYWPTLFSSDAPRPLAVGVAEQLAADMDARGLTGAGKIRAAIGMYTRRTSYLKALAAGGPRYTLSGEPAGEVTAEQQQRARETLMAMKKKEAVSCA